MDVKPEEFKNWHISSQVIKLISVCSEASETIGATSAPNLDSEGDKHDIKDDMQKLIAHSRGVDEKVNMLGLDDWALVDVEFNCSMCSQTITYYHMVEGREFGKENLSRPFRNMKFVI